MMLAWASHWCHNGSFRVWGREKKVDECLQTYPAMIVSEGSVVQEGGEGHQTSQSQPNLISSSSGGR